MVIAVTNENVNAINNKIRNSLKQQGMLTGKEYLIIGHNQVDIIHKQGENTEYIAKDLPKCFMSGDRVVFSQSDKALGINNGEFGTIVHAAKDKFTIEMDDGDRGANGKEIARFLEGAR